MKVSNLGFGASSLGGVFHGIREDVGFAGFLPELRTLAVAHGDGGVAVCFLHHELCHGFSHNVGAAQDDAFASGCLNVVTAEQFEDALGRGGYEAGQADGHASHVDGVEAVDILAIVNGLDDFLFGDVAGQGELHDEAVDIGIAVELVDAGQEFFLGHVVFITDEG